MTPEMVRDRVQPFVQLLRQDRPVTPILLVESPLAAASNPGNQVLRRAFDDLTGKGMDNLHYLPGDNQLAGDENGTVDGIHPTDLGFHRMAIAYQQILESILDPAP